MSFDLKFVELTADVLEIFFIKYISKSGAAVFLAHFWPVLGPGWGQG